MKHMIFYGPGTTPNILAEEDEADRIKKELMEDKDVEHIADTGEELVIKGKQVWAIESKPWTGEGRRKDDQ